MTADKDHEIPSARVALEALDAELGRGHFVTTLTVSGLRPPRLTVTSKLTLAGDDIHADGNYFWWSRGERFAAIDDPAGAAARITTILHAARIPPLRDRRRPPGRDEIVVTTPAERTLCTSREHARLGSQAEVVVTLGELGTAWQKDALWQASWGKSFALCFECWRGVRQVAEERRPGLIVTDATRPLTG